MVQHQCELFPVLREEDVDGSRMEWLEGFIYTNPVFKSLVKTRRHSRLGGLSVSKPQLPPPPAAAPARSWSVHDTLLCSVCSGQ